MLTRCLAAVVAAGGVLVPVQAAAEPVTIGLFGTARDTTAFLRPTAAGGPMAPGSAVVPPGSAAVLLALSSPAARLNALMNAAIFRDASMLDAPSGTNTPGAVALGALRGGGWSAGWSDATGHHAPVANGSASSNVPEAVSAARGDALDRSAVYVGGGGSEAGTPDTHAPGVALVGGVAAVSGVPVALGLTGHTGRPSFLAGPGAEDGLAATPEPASVLLIGTGLAGLAAIRRRRRTASGA